MKKASIKPHAKKTATKTTSPSNRTLKQKPGTAIDLVAATLIVSVLINLFVVCVWATLRVTAQYDDALSQFFLGR